MKPDRPRSPSLSIALLVDHGGLQDAHPDHARGAAVLADRLWAFATSLGRVAVATAYGDWTELGDDAREYHRHGIEARLVLPHESDDDRSDLVLSLDALAIALAPTPIETFVIASADAGLREIVVRLRGLGHNVVVSGPRAETSGELRTCADRFVPLESLTGGSAVARGPESSPPRPRKDVDFATYDWTRFLRLLDELEKRLDFVGLKYLNHKVLNRENCGFNDRPRRQALINHAIDEGILQIYRIDNIEAGGDPVTACRLGRDHEIVRRHLGASSAEAPAKADGGETDTAEA